MKRLLALFLLTPILLNSQNYQKEWIEIEKLKEKNQPKIVLKKIENIYQKSKKDSNENEFIKSLLYKIKYQYLIEKDLTKEIKEVEKEIEETSKLSTKLILKSILAQLYSIFLNNNIDELRNITYMDDKNNKNIHTWSIKRVKKRIKNLYIESLDDKAQNISIKEYKDILTKSQNSENLMPTLYDFLAFRALSYFDKDYSGSEHFYIDKKEAFGGINTFITYKFDKLNKKSSNYQALLIYQRLLKFHKKDKNNRVLSYINLQRLRFVYKYFNPKTRDRYYLSALKSLDSQHIDSQALYLAEYYFNKSKYQKAIEYAKKGIKSDDRYICEKSKDIKNRIESKYLGIDIEPISLPFEKILAKVTYKNSYHIFIKVIKTDKNEQKVIGDFNISVPKTDDYKRHSTEISLGDYDLGEYIFIVSTDRLFQKNTIYYPITISKIAYFFKNSKILILRRDTGEPIEGATILFYDKQSSKKPISRIKSDKNGLVEVPKILNRYYIEIENGKDRLNLKHIGMNYKKPKEKKDKPEEKIYFFTDKSIYTQSDNIKFKGLMVKQFSNKKPQVIANRKIEVALYNNNQKIESKIFKSDEFGAIYGSFHTPEDDLGTLKLYSKLGTKNLLVADINQNETYKVDKNSSKEKQKYTIDIAIAKELDKNSAKILKIISINEKKEYIDIKGKITIEKLYPQTEIYKNRYWTPIDKPLYSLDEFKKLFPKYRYTPKKDRKKILIKTIEFDTKKSKEILLNSLEQGEYQITLYSKNRIGKKITKTKNIVVYDIAEKKPPYQTYLWHKIDKKSYKVGSTATIYIKSSQPHTKALFELSRDGKTLQEEWIDINGSTQIQIPITKDDRGDIFYSLSVVKDNRNYTQKGTIKVPWDSKLKVEYISFRDRLKPNSKERWKLKVDTKDSVQMVATMYNMALDNILNSFDIPNLYPKHYRSRYNQWQSYDFFAKNRDISWGYKPTKIERKLYKLRWIRDIIKREKSKKSYSKESKKIKIPKSLNRTLFFKPNLTENRDKDIPIEFKTDNSISKWRFLGFIHTKDLKTAITTKTVETQKEIIVKANLPKFFRENDQITISQKVINRSGIDLNGTIAVELINPATQKKIYPDLNFTKPFKIKKDSFETIKFSFKVPNINKSSAIEYKTTIKAHEYLDTQSTTVPILTQKSLITKNQPIYLKAKEKKTIQLDPPKEPNSTTTIEFSSNPAWYALEAIPYIIEYPCKSNEQLFYRYFTTAIAIKLLQVSPKIEQILKGWRERLATAQKTPSSYFQDIEHEKRDLALLLDITKLKKERDRAYKRLIKQQFKHYDGGWSWFDKGESNWYITQQIVEGFAKLKQFGIDKTDTEAMGVATAFMDREIEKEYKQLQQRVKEKKTQLKDDHLSSIIVHYLYTRSFYQFPLLSKEAHNYYLNQAKKYWRDRNIYEQAMIAIALNKNLDKKEAIDIVKSIKKRAILDENGLYFDYKGLYPIKTHTTIMYLFESIAKDKKSVELMKRWLIAQKVANHWKTVAKTVDALYALLYDNAWILNKNRAVEILFPNNNKEYQSSIKKARESYQKGIGYLKISLKNLNRDIKNIKIINPNSNPIWGNIYWQYLKDINKTQNSPFSITKKLSIIKESKIEKKIIPIEKSSIKIGDKIEVKIKVKIDQDMQYLVIKDEIASAFEPIKKGSSYRYQEDLGYFESITDSSICLFFDKLPKGEYIFNYPLVVKYKGKFNIPKATIKSNYSLDTINYSNSSKIKVE